MDISFKILLISYADYNYDGRLRALINVFSQLGELCCFIKAGPRKDNFTICDKNYRQFIKASVAFAKTLGTIDCLVLDNRKATIPGLKIQKKCHPRCVIQDCRELYLFKEMKHFTGKAGCLFEKKMAQRADIIICANQERAQIMQREYGLLREPLAYENLRMLQYESEKALERAKEKFAGYLQKNEIRIISSSGCSIKRTNDILVKNLKNVNQKCRLFLVSNSEPGEESVIKAVAEEDLVNEINILGQLDQTELKYLISQCHIGIVNYGQYDTNNKYCASGKLYEFLYEGIPVVTTTNPPLKRMCETEKIGIADDKYYGGINEIMDNYDYYCENVRMFSEKTTIEDNDNRFIRSIKTLIDNKLQSGR